jgi:hypothetical protein
VNNTKSDLSGVQHGATHLDNLAVHGARCLAEKLVCDEEIIRIQFLDYGEGGLDEPRS